MPTKPVRDFGGGRRYGMVWVIGVVILITGGGGYFTYEYVRNRGVNIATANAWDIKGPPCAQLTAEQWGTRHLKARQVFDYDGRKIGRWSGDANCNDIHTSGGAGFGVDRICQFTNPTNLLVMTPKGTFYYDTGTGQPATLSIHQDMPKCVLASKFTRASK
jgi:hypothetical protein